MPLQKRSLTFPRSGPVCPDAVIACQRPPTEPGADRGEAGLIALRQIPHGLPFPRHLGQALPIQAEQLMRNHALPSFEAHALRQETVRPTNGREFCGRPEQHHHELVLYLGVSPRQHDPWPVKKVVIKILLINGIKADRLSATNRLSKAEAKTSDNAAIGQVRKRP